MKAELNQPSKKRTFARIGQVIALVVTATLMVSAPVVPAPAQAQVTYNLVDFPFVFFGATEVAGNLTSSTTGTFTTVAEIENFLNSATYNVVLKDGSTTVMELDNTNTSWSMVIHHRGGLGGATAMLTATASEITLDFSTPNEYTAVHIFLGPPSFRLQFTQGNNNRSNNFVHVDYGLIQTGNTDTDYDAPFIFPALAT